MTSFWPETHLFYIKTIVQANLVYHTSNTNVIPCMILRKFLEVFFWVCGQSPIQGVIVLKIINFRFREQIVIERIQDHKTVTIKIIRTDRNVETPLTSADHIDIAEVLLRELSFEDKHRVIMNIIATMPDYMKQQYTPADIKKRR